MIEGTAGFLPAQQKRRVMEAMKRIALIGMPGSGKSSVGRQLSKRLDVQFADSDAFIEHRLKESIRSYFAREGEERFRDVEEQTIQDLCTTASIGVLATGGGCVLRAVNRRVLGSACTVLYLRSPPDELQRRLRHDTHRPLLQVKDPRTALRKLYQERDPLYRETAHFIIETGRPTVQTLVGMILMQLELAGCVDPMRVPSAVEARR